MDNGGEHFRALRRFCCFVGCFAVVIVVPWLAHADYDGDASPEIQAWFRTVHNGEGQVCCDGTEVVHVSDYQWRGDHYDIVVDGVTYHASPSKVATEPNRLGDAISWFYPKGATRDDKTLRCFMRGTEG